MRGQNSAFLCLFTEETPPEVQPAVADRPGRNEDLVRQRDELLLHRYYYYVKIVRRQYQDTLDLLQAEFFLSQRRIVDIIQASDRHKELNMLRPDVKYFRQQYPHWVWNAA